MPRIVIALSLALTSTFTFAAEPPVRFDRDVLPILSDHCFACHGPDPKSRKADLRLDTKAGALRTEHPVIVPNKSAASEMVRRVVTKDGDEVMPPSKSKKPLSTKQIETLKRWVDEGAAWGTHWAFDPPKRPSVPSSKFQVRNPIDAFVQARLVKEGLTPSPEATRETLIRRVTLDLTGLPPTLAEVDAFLADKSPDAYEKVVDRLLASPRYGERMVWEWLEAARYADSNGYQGDGERTMWPWRDWAVRAFNADMPYDQFTVWQIAGDQLPNATLEQKLATGFLRNHAINGEGGRIPDENRVDYVMDMTETVGTVWLGLTFTCCRCHDHKFDPLKQSEYYGLFAFFNQTPVTGGGGDPQTAPVVEMISSEQEAKLKELRAKHTAAAKDVETLETQLFPRDKGKPANESAKAKDLPGDVKEGLKQSPTDRGPGVLGRMEKEFTKSNPRYAEKLKALLAAVNARNAENRAAPRVMVMADLEKPRDTFILTKGLYNKPAEKVSFGTPSVMPPLPAGSKMNRLTLAKWLVNSEHPLTARVTVNRLWAQFFGIGLVKTAEDFGIQGERPGNQELLDWLAVEFMTPTKPTYGGGWTFAPWSLKHIVRLLVTSNTYRQSSKITPALFEKDPENRLLARAPRFRMPSWMIRDQALAASGLLVEKAGGSPVRPYQPPGVWEEATFGSKSYQQDHGDSLYRRSVYTFWRRIIGPTMFFDSSARQTCTVKSARTNTPLHALATLNDPTYVEAARALAESVLTANSKDDGVRIETAFRRVVGRKPAPTESPVLMSALARLRKQYAADAAAAKALLAVGEAKRNEKLDAAEHAAWTGLCLMVLNLDETLSKE